MNTSPPGYCTVSSGHVHTTFWRNTLPQHFTVFLRCVKITTTK